MVTKAELSSEITSPEQLIVNALKKLLVFFNLSKINVFCTLYETLSFKKTDFFYLKTTDFSNFAYAYDFFPA